MYLYEPGVHTPDALYNQITAIRQTNPDALLSGSLGRAVLFGQADDSHKEYALRGQKPLVSGSVARDIDLIGANVAPDLKRPFYTDVEAYDNPSVSITREGSDWVLSSLRKGFSERIRPEVMEPVIGTTVYGIPAATVRLQTHAALIDVHGVPRRKDSANMEILARLKDSNPLPETFYTPFKRLAAMQPRGIAGLAQLAYRRLMPTRLDTRYGKAITDGLAKHRK